MRNSPLKFTLTNYLCDSQEDCELNIGGYKNPQLEYKIKFGHVWVYKEACRERISFDEIHPKKLQGAEYGRLFQGSK